MSPAAPGTGWRIVGASVAGVSHRRHGLACQDSHRWREVNRVLIAAVADGAGSAACAELGSALAVQEAVDAVAARVGAAVPADEAGWKQLLRETFASARRDLEAQAAGLDMDPLHLATTLLVLVASPGWLAAGQVGDGAIIIRQGTDHLEALTTPAGREYVNETTFLTSPGSLDQIQLVVRPAAANGVALLTDGLQMLALKMPQGLPHAAFFLPLLKLLGEADQRDRAETQLETFLQSPRITQRADDDLTLLLGVRC